MTSTDAQEALDEAMFALSARLKLSGFLDDGANHAAYERVVAVWTNRRTTPTPATEEREAVARAICALREIAVDVSTMKGQDGELSPIARKARAALTANHSAPVVEE